MSGFIKGLLYEYGEPSLMRVLIICDWILHIWAVHMAFYSQISFNEHQWAILHDLIRGSTVGGIGMPIANKYFTSKNMSDPGRYITKASPMEKGSGYDDNLRP